jgi:hypothetical protein
VRWRAGAALGVLLVVLSSGYAIGRSSVRAVPAPAATPGPFGHRHAVDFVGGLAVSDDGFTLVSPDTGFVPGVPRAFTFQIRASDGQLVQAYAPVHDRPLHMIVVRADLTGYQHLHPALGDDGTWRVRLTLPTAGVWRAYVDFTAKSPSQQITPAVLGINLNAEGLYRPAGPPTSPTESTVDGVTTSWQGTPRVNVSTPVDLRVSRADGPVTLERHLGAYGHLVLIRESDLGYLHFHASDQVSNQTVRFHAQVPSVGRYRAFVDLRFDGRVRTAVFTVDVG